MGCSLVCVTAHPIERWDGVADVCAEAPKPRNSTARRRASRLQISRAGRSGRAGRRPARRALPARGRRGRRRPGRIAWRSLRPPRLAAPQMLIGGTSPSTTVAVVPAISEDVDDGLTASRARPIGLGLLVVLGHRWRSSSSVQAITVDARQRRCLPTRKPPARSRSCASSRRSASGRRGSRRPR